MRITEMVQTMPNFLFALAIVSIIGPSIGNIILAIAVVAWPNLARLVRAEFLSFREREFVQACRGMGMSDFQIILGEILPNALPSAIVLGSVIVAFSILIEAALPGTERSEHYQLGMDDRAGPRGTPHRILDDCNPRNRHRAHRTGCESCWRGIERRAQSPSPRSELKWPRCSR
jgi:hypothetical protein